MTTDNIDTDLPIKRQRRNAMGNIFMGHPLETVTEMLPMLKARLQESEEDSDSSETKSPEAKIQRRVGLANLLDPKNLYVERPHRQRRNGVPDIWFGLPKEVVAQIVGEPMRLRLELDTDTEGIDREMMNCCSISGETELSSRGSDNSLSDGLIDVSCSSSPECDDDMEEEYDPLTRRRRVGVVEMSPPTWSRQVSLDNGQPNALASNLRNSMIH